VWGVLTHALLRLTLLPPTTSSTATLVQALFLLLCRHSRVCLTGTLCWDRLYYRAPLTSFDFITMQACAGPVRGECNIACSGMTVHHGVDQYACALHT
jgi:hypothetical protein